MKSYKDFTNFFGRELTDIGFKDFLSKTFYDLTEYDILKGDYMVSFDFGVELGFVNADAIYDDDTDEVIERGSPIFSHFNVFAKSVVLIDKLPFDVDFTDSRSIIRSKAGNPIETREGFLDLLDKKFLIDNYKMNDIVVSFDFDSAILNFIQIRDYRLLEKFGR